ncbi:hypothetical protein CALCODRAFT_364234 [Calocera cornea HHB12733]|uniref:Uncharacterized protein n=1 Tax=Calocera cornea HHB12733 TaxID=1353952 RepID=A0A165J8L8_9BASI|nr:hypothetical protein CALCODRAFT_364234 [Calocera cornea HHB12733]
MIVLRVSPVQSGPVLPQPRCKSPRGHKGEPTHTVQCSTVQYSAVQYTARTRRPRCVSRWLIISIMLHPRPLPRPQLPTEDRGGGTEDRGGGPGCMPMPMPRPRPMPRGAARHSLPPSVRTDEHSDTRLAPQPRNPLCRVGVGVGAGVGDGVRVGGQRAPPHAEKAEQAESGAVLARATGGRSDGGIDRSMESTPGWGVDTAPARRSS